MAKPKHEPSVYIELAREGLSNYAIAEQLGVSEASVRRGLSKAGYKRDKIPEDIVGHIQLDAPFEHIGPAIITADYHVPLFDPRLTNEVISVGEMLGIRTLIIAGDFFNMDALSRFEPKQEDADLWAELNIGAEVLRNLLQVFDPIYYLWGNHDARLHKTLGFKLRFDQAMRTILGWVGDELIEKVRFSNLDHMWVRPYPEAPPQRSWYICHPEAYTQIPLNKSRVIADKTNSNVITAHSHHFAQGWARDGKKIVAEAGGLFDASKTAYLQRTTSYPTWVNGFMWLEDLLNDNGTIGLGLRSPDHLWIPRS